MNDEPTTLTLAEFAKKLADYPEGFIPHDKRGHEIPIRIMKILIRRGGFEKVIEEYRKSLKEGEFASMARMPIDIYIPPSLYDLASFTAEEFVPKDRSDHQRVTFYPEVDEGWAFDALSQWRVKLVFYEK